MLKILAFSDLHHNLARADALVHASQEADLVLGAGDFCNHRQNLPEAMTLLSGIRAPVIAVPGNAESAAELREAAHAGTTVLHGTATEILGLKIFGLGYAVPETPFGDWSCDLSERDAAALLAPCDTADILLLHSPPQGIADITSAGRSVGSTAIRDAIARIQPKLALFGHIHDSWGREGTQAGTRCVNLGPTVNWFAL